MVANGSEPREILLDPMIAGSRGADGCEFDLELDLECSPRVKRLEMIDMMGLEDEPAQNSAAIAYATREIAFEIRHFLPWRVGPPVGIKRGCPPRVCGTPPRPVRTSAGCLHRSRSRAHPA